MFHGSVWALPVYTHVTNNLSLLQCHVFLEWYSWEVSPCYQWRRGECVRHIPAHRPRGRGTFCLADRTTSVPAQTEGRRAGKLSGTKYLNYWWLTLEYHSSHASIGQKRGGGFYNCYFCIASVKGGSLYLRQGYLCAYRNLSCKYGEGGTYAWGGGACAWAAVDSVVSVHGPSHPQVSVSSTFSDACCKWGGPERWKHIPDIALDMFMCR